MAKRPYHVGDQVRIRVSFLTVETLGRIRVGESALTVNDATGYTAASPIYVEGAGIGGEPLFTTVSSVVGNVLSLATPAGESVSEARVGKLTDTTSVGVRVREPDDTLVTVTPVTSIATGRYEAVFEPSKVGEHPYRGFSTGTVKASEPGLFRVDEQEAA